MNSRKDCRVVRGIRVIDQEDDRVGGVAEHFPGIDGGAAVAVGKIRNAQVKGGGNSVVRRVEKGQVSF